MTAADEVGTQHHEVTADRNRVTVRRALRAGAVAGVLAGGLMAVYAARDQATGGAVIASFVAAFGFFSAAWLLLAALLDVVAGQPPNRRRTLWTIAVTLLAMLGPFLVLGALFQPVTSGAAP